MFQRIKGAIDSRIAEEQARQRSSQASPSRSLSNAGRSSSRNLSPSKRVSRKARGREDGESPSKGPDPAEFEPDFVIEDDAPSRSGTPKPPSGHNGVVATDQKKSLTSEESSHESVEQTAPVEESRTSSDLSTDVRVKLRKLEKLESRYHELLRSYRVAHAKVLTIEPFETSLRENTPLTSISDPKAFVEYLNQVNLKGDMVLDELKRVSSERDTYRQKVIEAEKNTKDAWDEVANIRNVKNLSSQPEKNKIEDGEAQDPDTAANDGADGDPLQTSGRSPPASIKSPATSVRGLSLFSPKSTPIDSAKSRQESEDLFSFDDEIPRLETELKGRQQKIKGLENEVEGLKGDLAVTRESTQSMVQTLEEMTRELTGLRENKDHSVNELRGQILESDKVSDKLRIELLASESRLREHQCESNTEDSNRINELCTSLQAVRDELDSIHANKKNEANATTQSEKLQTTITRLQAEISGMQTSSEQSERKIDTLNKIVASLRAQLKEADQKNQDLKVAVEMSAKSSVLLREKVDKLKSEINITEPIQSHEEATGEDRQDSYSGSQRTKGDPAAPQDASNTSKKKSKKKKKNNKSAVNVDQDSRSNLNPDPDAKAAGESISADSDTLPRLYQELQHARNLLDEKDASIERMHGKLKDQDGLREEIDTLRDDLVNVGQEHVEAKDKINKMIEEKIALETTVTGLEKELADLHSIHASDATGSDQRHKELATQFEDLKAKATALQTDLSAAQNLASTRFKDLNELRNVLQKAQPEINVLRKEAAEVKSVKEALAKRDVDVRELDSRHKEIGAEIAKLRKIATDRDSEIKSLSQRLGHESSNRNKADEAQSKLSQENQRLETEKRRAMESSDRLTKEIEKLQAEISTSKMKLKDIEQQFSRNKSENESLKEDIDLKTAQYASAQSLMASMRDQTTEMAVQMKEARERCESLDEEVADAHRLLSERSREGETMRRLLADVEGRAEARTREMKERMDTAMEERDRAEDEASTAGRRRAREIEDLRNKHRDLERNLKRAEEDKDELEVAQRDWKRRREELEHQMGQSTGEVDEIRRAMGELRDALDESERQARDLEKQKAELRRSVEETQHRLEKVQKSNKSMADEIGKFQTARSKTVDPIASSRSTPDSTPRLGSPAPKSRNSSVATMEVPNGQPPGAMDLVYLKNVLLQFLEQKDKKHQMQLVPVLGMLLHFDRKDEQKWMSAITTKA